MKRRSCVLDMSAKMRHRLLLRGHLHRPRPHIQTSLHHLWLPRGERFSALKRSLGRSSRRSCLFIRLKRLPTSMSNWRWTQRRLLLKRSPSPSLSNSKFQHMIRQRNLLLLPHRYLHQPPLRWGSRYPRLRRSTTHRPLSKLRLPCSMHRRGSLARRCRLDAKCLSTQRLNSFFRRGSVPCLPVPLRKSSLCQPNNRRSSRLP